MYIAFMVFTQHSNLPDGALQAPGDAIACGSDLEIVGTFLAYT